MLHEYSEQQQKDENFLLRFAKNYKESWRIKERSFLRKISGYYADEIIFAWMKLRNYFLYSLCKKQKENLKPDFLSMIQVS